MKSVQMRVGAEFANTVNRIWKDLERDGIAVSKVSISNMLAKGVAPVEIKGRIKSAWGFKL